MINLQKTSVIVALILLCLITIVSVSSLPHGAVSNLIYKISGASIWIDTDRFEKSEITQSVDPKFIEEFKIMSKKLPGNIPIDTIKKYYSLIGPNIILDVIEDERNFKKGQVQCHEKGHNVGIAVYENTKDIQKSLEICGLRCTSSCLHGVFYALGAEGYRQTKGENHIHKDGSVHFHHILSDDIIESLKDICKQQKLIPFQIGIETCYHAIGHGFAHPLDFDIDWTMKQCSSFKKKTAVVDCAYGAYMEHYSVRNPNSLNNFSCDDATYHPAACYRTTLFRINKDKLKREKIIPRCLSQTKTPNQLGCLTAIGRTVVKRGYFNPGDISFFCGNLEINQAEACIKGFIDGSKDPKALHQNISIKYECNLLSSKLKKFCLKSRYFNMYYSTNLEYYYYNPDDT